MLPSQDEFTRNMEWMIRQAAKVLKCDIVDMVDDTACSKNPEKYDIIRQRSSSRLVNRGTAMLSRYGWKRM